MNEAGERPTRAANPVLEQFFLRILETAAEIERKRADRLRNEGQEEQKEQGADYCAPESEVKLAA